MKIEVFTNKHLVKYFGMTPRQANHWTERGLISCIIDARGTGSQRGYDIHGVFEAGIVKALFDLGLSIYRVKNIMNQFIRHEKLFNIMDQTDKPRDDIIELVEKGPIGVLLYYFMKDGSGRLIISLRRIRDVFSGFNEDSLPNEGISNIRGFIFLDVGSIWWQVFRETLKESDRDVLTDKWEYTTETEIPPPKKK